MIQKCNYNLLQYFDVLCPKMRKRDKMQGLFFEIAFLACKAQSVVIVRRDYMKTLEFTRQNAISKYSKTCVKRPLKNRQNRGLNDK